jgi:hypothetical protein
MVDNILAYSKRPDVLQDLDHALHQLGEALAEPAPHPVSVRSSGRVGRVWAMTDRLTDAQVRDLVAAFRTGTPKWKLAEQYGISPKSVQRLVRHYERQEDNQPTWRAELATAWLPGRVRRAR